MEFKKTYNESINYQFFDNKILYIHVLFVHIMLYIM